MVKSPLKTQEKVFKHLIDTAKKTVFGKDHDFNVKTYEDFKARVPIRDYEGLKPYIEQIQKGEKDVLWKGRPIFCKTSGTIWNEIHSVNQTVLECQIQAAKHALLHYIEDSGNDHFINGKMIFLQDP